MSSSVPPLRLVTISPVGVEICVIQDTLTGLDGAVCFSFCIDPAAEYHDLDHRPLWYRLRIGGAGRRCLVPAESPCVEKVSHIAWNTDGEPALWAIPSIDFDETLGLTVVGNILGELAIYDHVGQNPECCAGLAIDLTDQKSPVPPLLPTIPLKLNLPSAPTLEMSHSDRENCVATWSQDNLNLDSRRSASRWNTTWIGDYGYWDYYAADMWHGTPCDLAWILEHGYGFPGRVLPQAFQRDLLLDGEQNLLFRVGNRYLAFRDDEHQFLSFAGTPSGNFDVFNDRQLETFTRPAAMTERDSYLFHRADEADRQKKIKCLVADEDIRVCSHLRVVPWPQSLG
ncbi:hypothetical protein B0H12DRAFT_1066967 [Mycena haematopus]|nr:hypothetical protein B0H12DRAFT_1066967 [Mycena haematopus]